VGAGPAAGLDAGRLAGDRRAADAGAGQSDPAALIHSADPQPLVVAAVQATTVMYAAEIVVTADVVIAVGFVLPAVAGCAVVAAG
jgi:hypothetical protein